MKKLVRIGIGALVVLLVNNTIPLQSNGIASAQTDSVPGLAVSDEEVYIEEGQDRLTLYWAGRVAFVKPSKAPISIVIESSLSPAGSWLPAPSSRFRLISAYKTGVNSLYQKAPVASMNLPQAVPGKATESALASLLEKDQVINVKIAIKGLSQSAATKAVAEMECQLKPLGYALLKAAQAGDLAAVRELLDKGVEADSADLQGWTALMAASATGRPDIVRLLLDKGAKVNARGKGFPITLSANGSNIPSGTTALMVASYSGYPEIAALLLQKQAAVNAKREDRWNALMAACLSGSSETVSMLLDAGANADAVDESGYSPLAIALANRNNGAVRLLKARGALLAVPWKPME